MARFGNVWPAIARARGDDDGARLHQLAAAKFHAQRTVAIVTVEPLGLERNGELGAELLRLGIGAPGQGLAGDAGGETQVVLDAGRCAGLAADGALVEHQHREAFGGGVDGGGESGGTGANHRHVVERTGSSLGVRPRHRPASSLVGRRNMVPLGQSSNGCSSSRMPSRSTSACASGSSPESRMENGIGVAGQEALQPHDVRHAGVPDQDRAGAVAFDQPDPAQDEGAHHDLADIRRADDESPQMAELNGMAVQPSRPARPTTSEVCDASWLISPEN